MLGAGNGVLLITPIWGKTATTTTVTVPVGAVYDGTAKTATAVTTNPSGGIVANPSVTYSPVPAHRSTPARTRPARAIPVTTPTRRARTNSSPSPRPRRWSPSQPQLRRMTAPHGDPRRSPARGPQPEPHRHLLRPWHDLRAEQTAPTAAGDYTASAAYPGDVNHTASSGNANYSIAKGTSVVTVTASNAMYDGNPHGGTAQVTGAGSLNETLTVTYVGRGHHHGPGRPHRQRPVTTPRPQAYPGDANHGELRQRGLRSPSHPPGHRHRAQRDI